MDFELIVLVFIALMLSAVTYKVFTMSTIDDDVEREFDITLNASVDSRTDELIDAAILKGKYSSDKFNVKLKARPGPKDPLIDIGNITGNY